MRGRVSAAILSPLLLGAIALATIGVPRRALATRPNDYVAQQLSFHQIRSVEAWSYVTGSSGVMVAVLDSGVAWDHPDLAPNIWTNPADPKNGIDDDGDGYVDDVHGWNFLAGTGDVYDHLGRGTHVAGVIGAVGDNGVGVAGVCWHCTILPVKVLRDDIVDQGVNPEVGAAAIRYAVDRGARVIDVSFTTRHDNADLRDAVEYAIANGAVVVAAAGDDSANVDGHKFYPAAWDIPGLISVANVDQGAKLALSSNWGPQTISMVAPGTRVFSTLPGGFTGVMTGTPQAAAHVAGAAALLFSRDPSLSALDAASMITTLSSNRGILKGKVKNEGILDLGLLISEKRQTVDAHIVAPKRVRVGEIAEFDGSTSEGPIVEWLWKFGDPWDEFGKIVPRKWDRPGKVGVELQVRTADGRTASIDQEIEVVGDSWIPGVCEVGSANGASGGSGAGAAAALAPLALGIMAVFRRRKT